MDIVDCQVHLFMTMNDDVAVWVMDSLGIQAVLIDEVWAMGQDTLTPHYRLANGQDRPVAPGAIAASLRRPDRFSYLLRINPEDPEIDFVMSDARASPGCRAVRLVGWSPEEEAAAADGARFDYFRTANKHSLPVFIFTTGRVALYEQYIKAFPSLPIIFDHCGFPVRPGDFEDLLRLAAYPNVHLKWSHAPLLFSATRYPFPEVRPFLARALEAFGRERVMWCSDFTAVPYAASLREGITYTWGEALFHMRDNPDLSDSDKEWVLGRSARKVLNWPQP